MTLNSNRLPEIMLNFVQHHVLRICVPCSISGTLPYSLGFSKLRSLLASNNEISGAIPSWDTVIPLEQSLETLVLSRNYMRGPTAPLNNFSALTTLIIASNYFSCNSADLRDNDVLGQGEFSDPTTKQVAEAGEFMAGVYPFADPFKQTNVILNYSNTVMAYRWVRCLILLVIVVEEELCMRCRDRFQSVSALRHAI